MRQGESRGVNRRHLPEHHIRFIEIIGRFVPVSRRYFLRAGVGGIIGYLCLLINLSKRRVNFLQSSREGEREVRSLLVVGGGLSMFSQTEGKLGHFSQWSISP